MRENKRLAVYLGGRPFDETALDYTKAVAQIAPLTSIHVMLANDDPANPRPEPSLGEGLANITQYHRAPEKGLREFLAITREHDTDLVIVGRPLPSQHAMQGMAFLRLTRKSPCTVLVVPHGARPHFARVLVPVDYSEHSRMALEVGSSLAHDSGESNPQVIAMSVYSVGYGYSKAGVSFQEASDQMGGAAEKQLADFVANATVSGDVCEQIVCEAPDITEAVEAAAAVRHMDIVCIGSKGVTPDTVALVGSTTERMVAHLAHPVLVVKRKGETARFLDVLLGRA